VNVPFVAIVSYVGVCASAPRASKTRIATHIITAIAFEDVILRDVAVRARAVADAVHRSSRLSSPAPRRRRSIRSRGGDATRRGTRPRDAQ
jgi:hypothetical protein